MKTEIVTTLKREATRILSELNSDHDPILITEHGKPAAYLIDVDTFEHQQSRLRILEGIARGERAILEERVFSEDEAKARLSRWLD
jgi:prevent-host-death family protein